MFVTLKLGTVILSSFSQFPQEKGLQEFNVVITTEIRSLNYDLCNEAVINDWRITVSLGVNLSCSYRNDAKRFFM